MIAALGGAANIAEVAACMTRLRLRLVDPQRVDEAMLAGLGARGIVRPGGDAVQVVLGPIADQVAGEIRNWLSRGKDTSALPPKSIDAAALLQALGRDNLRSVDARSSRLIIELGDSAAVDLKSLESTGLRAVVAVSKTRIHLLVGAGAEQLGAELIARNQR
jgi:PTS system N-acetylglucosamine-specific IIC component